MMIEHVNDIHVPVFPPTDAAIDQPGDYQGLLASGGEVSPLWLNTAYRQGIFPWNSPQAERLWWSPVPRAVITADSFRLPRTVRKLLKKPHCITLNLAFRQVMEQCASPHENRQSTWISNEMIDGYTRMHKAGRALSAEYWDEQGQLVGGLYGILIGHVFFGESMFSRVSNASKITFASIAPKLFAHGIQLIDCQMHTEHLAQFGLLELNRGEFEALLSQAAGLSPLTSLKSIHL